MESIEHIIKTLDKPDPFRGMKPEYKKKYVHTIPDAQVVSRHNFILGQVIDKVVLDIGCGDFLSESVVKVSKKYYGVDREEQNLKGFYKCNVENTEEFGKLVFDDVEIILCCDIIEHLSNPGIVLDNIRRMYPKVTKIFTVPNFQAGFFKDYVKNGYENVNPDHVAYYSYNTMKQLLVRHGYNIQDFMWYENKHNYPHGFNEGLVFIAI